jgi:hypothetical protein
MAWNHSDIQNISVKIRKKIELAMTLGSQVEFFHEESLAKRCHNTVPSRHLAANPLLGEDLLSAE